LGKVLPSTTLIREQGSKEKNLRTGCSNNEIRLRRNKLEKNNQFTSRGGSGKRLLVVWGVGDQSQSRVAVWRRSRERASSKLGELSTRCEELELKDKGEASQRVVTGRGRKGKEIDNNTFLRGKI